MDPVDPRWREMRPVARQARQQIFQLRVFDLQLAFARAGALAENLQDQRRAIHDLAAEDFFQVARLGGAEFIVKNDRVHVVGAAKLREFMGLALADVSGGDGHGHLLHAFPHDLRAGGGGQFGQFGQRFTDVGGGAGLQLHANEIDAHRARVAGLLDERFQRFVVNSLAQPGFNESRNRGMADCRLLIAD